MNVKSWLTKIGVGSKDEGKSLRKSPMTKDRERFEADVREQFQKLKEKGISIPVFTL